MSKIQTWHERAMAHPDHQSGMVSEDMIRARMCEEIADLRAEVERLRVQNKRLKERLLQEQAALVLDEIGAALERERVMRSALTDMLSGWRYIRDTYGDLAGVGWDRVEQKACNALRGQAMSDTMLLGVLRMPFDLAMSTPTSRMQYHRRGVQAADEIEQLTRERDEARAALEPFSNLYLWPDDAGRLVAERVRSGKDWDEAANDAESNEYGITRGNIRAARRAMEAKP